MANRPAIEWVGDACTGCEACVALCPEQALQMEMNQEGFFYPRVQANLCSGCGLCAKRCPALSSDTESRRHLPDYGYAGGHREARVRLKSASGGAFSALVAAANVDVVYGAVWLTADCVGHQRVSPHDIAPLRTSKYIQSRIGNVYPCVKQDLESGCSVLFSGTPCQIAGLFAYLGSPSPNLTTVEIICHGVGSPGLFKQYVKELGERERSPVTSYVFRRKSAILGNWETFHSEIRYQNGKVHCTYWEPFTRLFLSKCILRPCCEACRYSGQDNHVADIILGDYWGCSVNNPALYHKLGVSAIIPLTSKGQTLLRHAEADLDIQRIPLNYITQRNQVLLQHAKHPEKRAIFFRVFEEEGLEVAIRKVCPRATWKSRLQPYLRLFWKQCKG